MKRIFAFLMLLGCDVDNYPPDSSYDYRDYDATTKVCFECTSACGGEAIRACKEPEAQFKCLALFPECGSYECFCEELL